MKGRNIPYTQHKSGAALYTPQQIFRFPSRCPAPAPRSRGRGLLLWFLLLEGSVSGQPCQVAHGKQLLFMGKLVKEFINLFFDPKPELGIGVAQITPPCLLLTNSIT